MDVDKRVKPIEFRQLQKHACVAFAARCARRVQPIFLRSWPTAPKSCIAAVDYAISVAEDWGYLKTLRDSVKESFDKNPSYSALGTACERAADAAADAAFAAGLVNAAEAHDVARAAAAAAATAHRSEDRVVRDNGAYNAYRLHDTAFAAYSYAISANEFVTGRIDFSSLICADFNLLLDLATKQKWTDDTIVLSSVFPPLDQPLPQGQTKWTIEESIEFVKQELIEIMGLREGASPDAARQKLHVLYDQLNQYSVAKFGKPLSAREFKKVVLEGLGPESRG